MPAVRGALGVFFSGRPAASAGLHLTRPGGYESNVHRIRPRPRTSFRPVQRNPMKSSDAIPAPSELNALAWEATQKLCETQDMEASMTKFYHVLASVLPLSKIILAKGGHHTGLALSETNAQGTIRLFKKSDHHSEKLKKARIWQQTHYPAGGILVASEDHPYAPICGIGTVKLHFPIYFFKRGHVTPYMGAALFEFREGTEVEPWMTAFIDQACIPLQLFINLWCRLWEMEQANSQILKENHELRQKHLGIEEVQLIGAHGGLKGMVEQLAKIAPLDITVLIQGETGSGKEMAAKALHQMSARKARPYIAVNCGAIPPSLIDSELFGHVKGAFTGAHQDHKGLFERAEGGTLFLDEVAELPLEVQARLLRVLETRTMERIGGGKTIPVNFRLISATNKNLEELAHAGRFRQDLFYRLRVAKLEVPPLRERKQDIPLLFQHFLEKAANRFGVLTPTVSPQEINRLMLHDWPGNVRELQNVTEESLAYALHGEFKLWPSDSPAGACVEKEPEALPTYDELVRDYLGSVLQFTKGKIRGHDGAAGVAALNYSTLRGKLRKYGIAHGKAADSFASQI